MRVLIAAASYGSTISGIQRHALKMASCLLRAAEIETVHFVIAPWQRQMVHASGLESDARFILHDIEMGRSSISRNAWYYRRLPEAAREIRADLVHVSLPMPVNRRAFPCPVVVTLHDLYPFEIPMNFGFPKFIFNQMVLRQCLKSADAIACVSEATKTMLHRFFPSVSAEAIRIYNCVDSQPATPAERPMEGWGNEPFLLCVAQHRKNKNLQLLISAFRKLLTTGQISSQTRLLIVGVSGPETRHVHRLIAHRALDGRVHLLQGLTESQLQWCYRHCEALVAPSITEGFGLPVAEAMLAGCRVVCSEIPAHWEIGAGHCRFVQVQDEGETRLAEAISSCLAEPKPQPVDLPELSAAALAREYVALYGRLITSRAIAGQSAALSPAISEGQLL